MKRRRWRIRKKIVGTVQRPRMSVRFTNKNIYVQFIDDDAGNTIASVSTRTKSADGLAANGAGAVEIGKLAGEAAKSAGIETAVFDRSGQLPVRQITLTALPVLLCEFFTLWK